MDKFTCPENTEHKRFYVTAWVSEEWLVDEDGDWIKTTPGGGETMREPQSHDYRICATCEAETNYLGEHD